MTTCCCGEARALRWPPGGTALCQGAQVLPTSWGALAQVAPPPTPPTTTVSTHLQPALCSCADVERAFARWQANRQAIVGFFPRLGLEGPPPQVQLHMLLPCCRPHSHTSQHHPPPCSHWRPHSLVLTGSPHTARLPLAAVPG